MELFFFTLTILVVMVLVVPFFLLFLVLKLIATLLEVLISNLKALKREEHT